MAVRVDRCTPTNQGGPTPHPWQAHGSHVYGPNPQRELVAQVHGNEGAAVAWSVIGGDRMIANRDLIVAAPELLNALMGLLHRHGDGSQEEQWAEWDAAREAIAKAEGDL